MPFLSMRGESRAGAKSTVFASFLHFDMCFTIWVLLGALSVPISKELGLDAFSRTVMVAVPTLSGSLMRIPMGLLSDRFGGKRIGTIMLLFLFIPLFLGWLVAPRLPVVLCVGLMLGVGGASFAVALPLASRWYPPSKQGLVMGIAAAGNAGVVFANLLAPSLAVSYGWRAVLAITAIPLAAVLLGFVLLAKDNPDHVKSDNSAQYLSAFKQSDMWFFCVLYSVTFGGFVGLGSFLPLFFNGQYEVSAVNAGYLTALATFMGSTFRPFGGYLADKFGGITTLSILLGSIAVMYLIAALLLPIGYMATVIVLGVALLGMGNGAVFQLVPQRFQAQVGIATGVVGACGGIGGFCLPLILGGVKQLSGSYSFGWVVLALVAVSALAMLRVLVLAKSGWRTAWSTEPTQDTAVQDISSPAPEYQV